MLIIVIVNFILDSSIIFSILLFNGICTLFLIKPQELSVVLLYVDLFIK
jgi:hypothetical protein